MSTNVPTLEELANQLIDEANVPPDSRSDRFPLTWADSVYDATEPLDFLVDGLFTKGSINLLVGEGGAKKTWASLDLAVCVALGKNWLDFPTKQSTVLIVDEESGPRRLRRRLYETLNGHLVRREDAPPIAFTSLSMTDLRNINDVNSLESIIRQTRAGLVIIDALADIMPGADENSVKDVQPVFMSLRRVVEATQSVIVMIHHANRQNGFRGSSAIKAAVDVMLMVESKPESQFITFTTEKTRDIEPRVFNAMATWISDPPQFYLTGSETKTKQHTSKVQRYVLRYLSENGNSPLDELAGKADVCEPQSARRAVYALVDSGHVRRTDGGGTGRGVKAYFDLTETGQELAKAEL